MRLLWLADVLRDAGLQIVEEPGWQSRGRDWSPVGGMQHHTAPPVPFPVDRLYGWKTGWRTKANLNTKPDGTIHVIAAGRCNYSSGPGSSVVLRETRIGVAPFALARTRGLRDDTNGNLYYVNNEADHVGDGRTIPGPQHESLIRMWTAIFSYMDWPATKLIAHAEWTARKIDPLWNGRNANRSMRIMRASIGGQPVKEETVFPIRRGDGTPTQRPEKDEDIRHYQTRLQHLGVDGGSDGIADQPFLDAVFGVVDSPLGGSYFSGEEGAIFEKIYIEELTKGGLRSGDTLKVRKL